MKLKLAFVTDIKFCVQKRITNLIASSENQKYGLNLFAFRKLELAPFESIVFSNWNDWEKNPLNNRSWQWRLNWLSFLSYLMAYHRAVGADAVLDMGKAAIESWLDTYLDTDTNYPFEFIWHDHATALRAEQFVLFAYYCQAYAPTWFKKQGVFFSYLEKALCVHAEWLVKDHFYSQHTNHGLEQARVLLLLGTVFDGAQAKKWQELALHRISSELDFSFSNEGVHVENSPAYHIFVFKVFLNIIKDYPAEVLGDLEEKFNQFSVKALEFITYILRPDGLLPPIGDTEQLPTSDTYRQMFGSTSEYQSFLYAVTKGKKGVKPSAVNRVYSSSGYAVFRDQWYTHQKFEKALHLVVKVGCSSRYHHQQDEGHISLYAGGEDWLIDSGLYNYINADPLRKYMRSRAAHNVPLISHANYDKDFEHRLRTWRVTDYSENIFHPFVRMELRVMPPVLHERQVDLDSKNKIVSVQDCIAAEDDQLRDITLQWHIPIDKKLAIADNVVTVTGSKGNKLTINFQGDNPDKLMVVSGRQGDKVFSCISYKANHYESSQLLQVFFVKRKKIEVTTKFLFKLI